MVASREELGASRPPDIGTGYRGLVRNRRYLLWQTGATAASVGYAVYAISVPWVAFQSTGDLWVVGLALFAELGIYTPTFLVGPWVDRARNKRTIYLLCYPAQAVGAAVLGAAVQGRFLTLPLFFGLILFLSLLWDFAWAANNVAPRLLVERDELFPAAGLGGVLGGGIQLAGYAGGALLLALVGSAGGFYLYATLLVVAAGFSTLVSLPGGGGSVEGGYLAEFREGGACFARRSARPLRKLASVELLRGFFFSAPTLLSLSCSPRSCSPTRVAPTRPSTSPGSPEASPSA